MTHNVDDSCQVAVVTRVIRVVPEGHSPLPFPSHTYSSAVSPVRIVAL